MIAEVERPGKGEIKPGSHIHFVGIGGFGLSAIARVLLGKGFRVSGSDLHRNELTDELEQAGAVFYEGHDAANISGADALLVSSAVPPANAELVAAQIAGIPVLKRAEFIGSIMEDSYGIAVAGTHGKTTTTGMIAQIMVEAGLDPSVIVGGVLPLFGTNGRAGEGSVFIVEADEYDYMFLGLHPNMAVITNIEYDHPDMFQTKRDYIDAFSEFIGLVPESGLLILCTDDAAIRDMVDSSTLEGRAEIQTYGFSDSIWRAEELRPNQLGGLDFLVTHHGESIGLARVRVPGEHNVLNALAASVVAMNLDIDFKVVRKALAEFNGVGRRFEKIGEAGDVVIIDDYAHHPTEIRATLSAARLRYSNRRIWAVWQPHTYSRIQSLELEFQTSFGDADIVLVMDVFKSREQVSLGVDEGKLAEGIEHPNCKYSGDIVETTAYILDRIRPGDVVITLTAGDGNMVGAALLDVLRQREESRTSTNGSIQNI